MGIADLTGLLPEYSCSVLVAMALKGSVSKGKLYIGQYQIISHFFSAQI